MLYWIIKSFYGVGSMLFVSIIVGLYVAILLISVFIRYHPYIDLVLSYNKYILLLWYNKDGGRTYIKLLEL